MTGRELWYISQAHANGHLAGNGDFSRRCCAWLEQRVGSQKALLTHSCTAALEMAAILSGVGVGDEVIMPSFTFVSTANAFVLRGATPVFVDIRPDTLNIDESKIEAAITPRTRAIVPVHYAGVGCDMDTIMEIARSHDLLVDRGRRAGSPRRLRGRTTREHRPHGSPLLPRDQERLWAKVARCWSMTPGSSTGPRSSGRRGPTEAGSSGARSTSTPGSTSGRHTCQVRTSLPSSGHRWRRRGHHGAPTGDRGGYRAAFADLEHAGASAGRWSRPTAPTWHTLCHLLLPDSRAPDSIHRATQGQGVQWVFRYVSAAISSPFGQIDPAYGR